MAHTNPRQHFGLSPGMYAEELLCISTGKLKTTCRICEFKLCIQNKLIQSDNNLMSAKNRGLCFHVCDTEAECLFKELCIGSQWVTWFSVSDPLSTSIFQ